MTCTRDDRILPLLERASLLRYLSRLLQPPAARIGAELTSLAATIPAGLRDEGRRLAARFEAEPHEVEPQYHRLLGASGVCRDCESDHRPPSLGAKAAIVEVASYYQAFGFAGAAEVPAPADQLGVELSFAGYLALKQAYARERGAAEEEAISAEAYARFAGSHLAPYLGGLLGELAERAGEGSLYAEAARFALAALGHCEL
jgi:TorA maturation chaperone TorD